MFIVRSIYFVIDRPIDLRGDPMFPVMWMKEVCIYLHFVFTARCYASAVYAIVMCLCVCVCVCLSLSGIVSKRLNRGLCK